MVAALLLATIGWLWSGTLLPASYSVMDMGYADTGGHGHGGGHGPGGGAPGVSVTALGTEATAAADVAITLVARRERFALASGRQVDGYTLNGSSPGPTIEATQGQLVEVRLVNESVPSGVTLHWHGVDVPNAADGVAGVTQDAVEPGGEFVYRFVAKQAGTFWYHSHQLSHEQVKRGLFGALILRPPEGPEHADAAGAVDVTALLHVYDGVRTINGRDGESRLPLTPSTRARVRVINTDNGATQVWLDGASFRVLAVDGTEVNAPTAVTGESVLITAGGRADFEVVTPPDGAAVRITVGGSASLVLGPDRTVAPLGRQPAHALDLLSYGSPADVGALSEAPDREFDYIIGRRPGLLDGRPGLWWTINGHLYPDVPMYMVAEGDVVRMRISNTSGDVHPMHLHGHHALVLSRNGVAATGSPWWVDSLHVADGDTYVVAFVADNPGIWMDHCHNLPHAGEGLVAHLAYEGVTTPFVVGGPVANRPE